MFEDLKELIGNINLVWYVVFEMVLLLVNFNLLISKVNSICNNKFEMIDGEKNNF